MIEIYNKGVVYTMSGCTRLHVEAFAFDAEGTMLDKAENGPVSGDECTGEEGNCGCVHAEYRLVNRLRFDIKQERVVHVHISHSPCEDCARYLVNYLPYLEKVTFNEFYRDPNPGLDVLAEATIDHYLIPKKEQESSKLGLQKSHEKLYNLLKKQSDKGWEKYHEDVADSGLGIKDFIQHSKEEQVDRLIYTQRLEEQMNEVVELLEKAKNECPLVADHPTRINIVNVLKILEGR